MSDRKTGYSPLNAENNRDVANDVMFAHEHTKINIQLSVLSILFSLFYCFSLNTQGFVYLEFVKYQLGLHRNVQLSQNAMYAYLLYSCLYTDIDI